MMTNVPSGTTLTVESGATINIASGATMTRAGTETRASVVRQFAANAKAGTTAGWAVNAGDNKNSLARLPASQAGSTLVIPLTGFKVGDIITAFSLVGQVESGGNNVTIDAELRKQTAAAADLSDANVASMTQLVVAVDTILSASNTAKTGISDTIAADETFYLLITATTTGSTDIDLQGALVTVTES